MISLLELRSRVSPSRLLPEMQDRLDDLAVRLVDQAGRVAVAKLVSSLAAVVGSNVEEAEDKQHFCAAEHSART